MGRGCHLVAAAAIPVSLHQERVEVSRLRSQDMIERRALRDRIAIELARLRLHQPQGRRGEVAVDELLENEASLSVLPPLKRRDPFANHSFRVRHAKLRRHFRSRRSACFMNA
jgi:hypothetical protein